VFRLASIDLYGFVVFWAKEKSPANWYDYLLAGLKTNVLVPSGGTLVSIG